MTERQTRSEGWYADPLGQADLRWWDSQNWTMQVRSGSPAGSRPNAASATSPLQWAEDDLPAPRPASPTNRVAPPTAKPPADPKFALGSTSTDDQEQAEASGGPDWSPLMLTLLTAGDKIVPATA